MLVRRLGIVILEVAMRIDVAKGFAFVENGCIILGELSNGQKKPPSR
jgi:hypothetical protein